MNWFAFMVQKNLSPSIDSQIQSEILVHVSVGKSQWSNIYRWNFGYGKTKFVFFIYDFSHFP